MTEQIAYYSHYFPPIPVLHVHLRVPDTSRIHGPARALVDTGADMTIAPLAWLDKIAAPELDELLDGPQQIADVLAQRPRRLIHL